MMRGTSQIWLGALSLMCVATSAFAGANTTAPANHYDVIPARNLFNLREPVVQVTNVAPPELPKVYLLGITTLGGQKRVYLKREAGKGAATAGDETKVLSPGDKDGDIEVVDIDEVDKRVLIRQAGTEMVLTFDKNAPKSNPPANVAGAQGVPQGNPPAEPVLQGQNPAQPSSLPAAQPGLTGVPTPGPTMKRLLPQRNLSQVTPPPLPGAIPAGAAVKPNPAAQQITPQEEQQILNELERLKANPNPY